jgi:C-terminal processing protease CtpA/Prc
MTRTWIVAAFAALTLWPAAAAAQETPRPRPRATPRARASTPFGVFSFSDNRGRIGVVVKTEPDAADDKLGARIEAVTPGGPAEKAGLKAGDIITRFSGTALGGAPAEDDDASGPGMKLIELARALDPGDTVRVDYRRGSETRSATIVAEEIDASWSLTTSGPGRDFMIDPDIRMHLEELPRMQYEFGPGGAMQWMMGGPWGGIELVSLNPDLGDYFGTREGVLVVRASQDSTLPLKGGDVILAIGGRKPTSPMHAMRILRSYDSGETVSIEVLRKQKRTTLTWKVPDADTRVFERTRRPRGGGEEPSAYKLRSALLRAARVI